MKVVWLYWVIAILTPTITAAQPDFKPSCAPIAKAFEEALGERLDVGNCQLEALSEQVALIRVLGECGGDSCTARAWVGLADGELYRLSDEEAVGTVLWSESLGELITEEVHADGAGRFSVQLYKRDLMSHRDPYLPCISPSISPDEAWLWCRKLDGSVWRANLQPDPSDYQQIYQLELVLRYEGEQPLYVVPYAYILPAAVQFMANGAIRVPFQTSDQTFYKTLPLGQ